MLTKPLSDFITLVWLTAEKIGRNAPAIADQILHKAFPRTYSPAVEEGAIKFLRRGAVDAIRNILKHGGEDDDATPGEDESPAVRDLWENDPIFAPIAKKLKSRRYFVEQQAEYRTVDELIAEPSDLDDARKLMRRKGVECLEEANVLDELFEAVESR